MLITPTSAWYQERTPRTDDRAPLQFMILDLPEREDREGRCIHDLYDLYDLYDLAHVAGW